MSLSRSKPPCERCGAPARVHVTGEASSGATIRHLCLVCAEAEEGAMPVRERSLNYGAILICVGLAVMALSLAADKLKFGGAQGFGPKQTLGLSIAAIFIFTAALVRIPTLLVIGVLTGGLTILADVFQFGHEPGFGWNQMLGTFVGLTLVGCGWLESRRQG